MQPAFSSPNGQELTQMKCLTSPWVKRRGFIMRLEAPAALFYQEERVVGTVRLRSMTPDGVQIRGLRVSLWALGSENAAEVIHEEVLVERRALSPLEEREAPFGLPVPRHSVVGAARLMLTTGGGLLRFVSGSSLNVMIAPERGVAGIVELIVEIARHDIAGWCVAGAGDGFHAQLTPRPEVADRLLGIGVELYPSGKGAYGTMIVMPRERGLLGALHAATLETRHFHHFRVPNTDRDTIRGEVEPILLSYLNDLRDLPLPARGGVTTEGLLLPSAENPTQ
jgi:hypothetical protein